MDVSAVATADAEVTTRVAFPGIPDGDVPATWAPAVVSFGEVVRADSELYGLLHQSIIQAAKYKSVVQIYTLDHLLDALNRAINQPPSYAIARGSQNMDGKAVIGVPFLLIFEPLALSPAGRVLFKKRAFNDALKLLLSAWSVFLTTRDSASTLHEGSQGWFGRYGLASLQAKGRGVFEDTYVCPNPAAIDRGFSSWDAFFTREVQTQARPFPKSDDTSLIYMACESTVFEITHNVQKHNEIVLKGRPYSFYDMLDCNSADADIFAGGTVFQGFLTPQDYHRWSSPVAGVVTKVAVVPGTYYAMSPDVDNVGPDYYIGRAIVNSQLWLTLNATRALIFIKSDNPAIGTVCFIGVGMCEVSSTEITVKEGERVSAGQEIGMFHYGGSSHVLLFGPQTDIAFHDDVCVGNHRHVRSILGRAHERQ